MKIKFIFLNLIFICVIPQEMKFHEFFLDLMSEDKIPFEYPAYKLLKAKPINKNINYLAVPWGVLISENKLNLLPKIKLNGGFTITRSTRFEEIIPILKKMGIDTLFTPHAIGKKYDGVKVLQMAHFNLNGTFSADKKDIFYSFVGYSSNYIRDIIFKMLHPKDAKIIRRNKMHYYIDNEDLFSLKVIKENEKREYQDILSRSRFSLCPRGFGPSTLRFWESLQAGAIPIVIADQLILPNGFDWNSCVIKIQENKLKELTQILSKITNEKEIKMRNNCIKAYELFSNENFVKVIRDHYN